MMETPNTLKRIEQLDAGAIALRAYHLWERAGRPQGRDREFWLEAEIQLRAEQQSKSQALEIPQLEKVPVAPVLMNRAIASRVETPAVSWMSSNRMKKTKGSAKR